MRRVNEKTGVAQHEALSHGGAATDTQYPRRLSGNTGIQFASVTLQRNVQVQMHTDKHTMGGDLTISSSRADAGKGAAYGYNTMKGPMLWTTSGPGTMQRITWPYIRFSPLPFLT